MQVLRHAQEPSALPQPQQLGPLARELRRLRLGALLLSAGEVANSRAADGNGAAAEQGGGIVMEVGGLRYGEDYVYDAGALAARLGRPLAAQLPAVRRLCGSMRCARRPFCQYNALLFQGAATIAAEGALAQLKLYSQAQRLLSTRVRFGVS